MRRDCDVLVVGSGIAGLSFALDVAEAGLQVAVITKKDKAEGATNYAQGGIAAALSDRDSVKLHVEDTLTVGDGLCDERVVRAVVEHGADAIGRLAARGVGFTRGGEGVLDLALEGGHSTPRVAHSADSTGREIERALLAACSADPRIAVDEDHTAVDLLVVRDGDRRRVWGAYVLDSRSGEIDPWIARDTLLATGGLGQAYAHTTNPAISTGDGVAMAYRAGAAVSDMEFVQFHPTAFYHREGPSFLISEAVRGAGAVLRLVDGTRFMSRHDPRAELAPRDVVARAIDRELKRTGDAYVLLDAVHLGKRALETKFPRIVQTCRELGVDPVNDPIPVVPAAHYCCGGVATDMRGATTLDGLFAAGEVAATGMHGANRLASNSLLEAVVFAEFAARAVREDCAASNERPPAIAAWRFPETFDEADWVRIRHDWRTIRDLMWNYVGIVRSTERLSVAESRLSLIAEQVEDFYRRNLVRRDLLELRNIATCALLIIKSALWRKESRGLHATVDFPRRDDERWLVHMDQTREGASVRPAR